MIDLLYKAVLMISLKVMRTTLDLRRASEGLSERHGDDPVPSNMEGKRPIPFRVLKLPFHNPSISVR